MPKKSLLTGVREVPGLDLEAALRNVGGREPVLARVLARFVATCRTGQASLLLTERLAVALET